MDNTAVEVDKRQQAGLRRWSMAGVAVVVLSILAFAALQYAMPPSLHSKWGLNPLGVRHFRQTLVPGYVPLLNTSTFVLLFKCLLIIAWAGYFLAVIAAMRGGVPNRTQILMLAIGLALILAVFCPPSLSVDCYGYAGFARMQVIYGENPHTTSSSILQDYQDPITPFIVWKIPSIYGPAWTQITIGLISLLKTITLWWQIVAIKFVAALALIAAAIAASRIADHFSPGRGNLTLLAVILNPLFLIEGPASGHNDLVMICFLLVGAMFFVEKRRALAWLLLGFSAGIKFITIIIVPWLIIERIRGKSVSRSILIVTGAAVLVILPILISAAPFWQGGAALSGIRKLLMEGPVTTGAPPIVLYLLIFVTLTFWLRISSIQHPWTAAWGIMAACLILLGAGLPFPWYMTWPLALTLTRWDRLHAMLSLTYSIVACMLMMMYVIK